MTASIFCEASDLHMDQHVLDVGESCPVSPTAMVSPIAMVSDHAMLSLPTDIPDDMTQGPAKKPRANRATSGAMRVWEYEEDQALLAAVSKFGKRWREIARLFHNRSEAMCRNRYTRIFAPHRPEMKGWKPSVNRCNACGQLKKGHSCAAKGKLFVNADMAFEQLVPVSEPEAPTVLAIAEPKIDAPQISHQLSGVRMLQPYVDHGLLTGSALAPAPAIQALAPPAPTPPPLLAECSDDRRIPLAELLCRLDSREASFASFLPAAGGA